MDDTKSFIEAMLAAEREYLDATRSHEREKDPERWRRARAQLEGFEAALARRLPNRRVAPQR